MVRLGRIGSCFGNDGSNPEITFGILLGFAVNETAVLETAHLMESLGLKDAGYEYLVVDGARNPGRLWFRERLGG